MKSSIQMRTGYEFEVEMMRIKYEFEVEMIRIKYDFVGIKFHSMLVSK